LSEGGKPEKKAVDMNTRARKQVLIMRGLTLRQQEILGYLRLYQKTHGTWPSFRDIQSHFNFKSTNAVMGHIRALERKGFITRVAGQARTFRITVDLDEENLPADAEEVVDIPVYGAIAAGYPDGVEAAGEVGRLRVNAENAGLRRARRSFALKVRGDSMVNAGIQDGDNVVVEQVPPRDGNIVAALIDGEVTLKRFIHRPGRGPFLKAENPAYPQLYPVSDLVIQGVARAIVRSL
jgi:repressor LexA